MDLTLDQALALKSGLVLAAFLAFAFAERWRPAVASPLLLRLGHATKAAWRRLARNLGLFGLNVLIAPLIVLPITWWAADLSLGLRPAFLAGWTGLLVDILVLDLWIYWWHRANHELPLLWRFHQVHHLDELLDTTSAVRFHFGEVVLSALARALVIILLDLSLLAVIVFEALILTGAIFHHSAARIPARLERALASVIVTPSIHWVHHHAIRADTDSNYGTIFSFWDRLFRSRSATARFAGMKIGVERMRDRPLLRLLAAPFGAQPAASPEAKSAPEPARR
ncbi:MAG: sterol desaturase family protein [Geminicoccaceae bacterium]|jgi:sterol desaturase/sphingolipid hydroxylase (fatty acid hydroxylase superfamily)|nr:sterol desaturase family protein [Geminicoccaceae bacterium]HRY25522.1 sterol desaturase family protein [Geminicoccaceae bacterium]